jgi:S1/P1 Nuclease
VTKTLSCAVAVLLVAIPLRLDAWNKPGHSIVASIAYDNLTTNTKMRVDALLAQHPDFSKWTQGVPANKRGKTAFLKASGWPDDIKDDPRFFDPGDPATPEIPGLPPGSNKRNREWHFTNVPFSVDGTPTLPPATVNVLTKLQDFQTLGTLDTQIQVFLIPWLVHLVGDVHQPLHTIALFRQDLSQGDHGGNDIVMKGGGTLHQHWDSRIGTGVSDVFIAQTAATIVNRHPKPAQISLDPVVWLEESFAQRYFVYSFVGMGTSQDKAVLSLNYATNAKLLAFERAAQSGYRLAEFLSQQLP